MRFVIPLPWPLLMAVVGGFDAFSAAKVRVPGWCGRVRARGWAAGGRVGAVVGMMSMTPGGDGGQAGGISRCVCVCVCD